MKRLLASGILMIVFASVIVVPLTSSAQTSNGQAIYTKFILGQVKCVDLKEADFLAVGNYVLTQVPEAQRSALNIYINQYKNTLGEKDYSVMMGKIFTGCEIPTAAGNVTTNGEKGTYNFDGYRGYWGMMSGVGMVWGIIKFVIGLVILLLIIRFVIRKFGGKKGVADLINGNTKGSAEEILDERYAKGEINKQEYEEKKKEIKK